MIVLKEGGHRLCEADAETSHHVSQVLQDLEEKGMEAVRRYRDYPANNRYSDEAIRTALRGLEQE